ncbi:GNAT family N-acetyltransferase [Mycobacteroides chelonae]|uniref:GNAT family N-acetyltransferase n=1 Tax=Mycobacteroides chelonae TaxID=1774 RepID=A0A1S1LSX2_MYCCH|nr:GNAT family N-acetyltransferase [Mycobacteroides chelonae]OHU75894.1 GNAT family N-acetyltransferase [Mycobacteroides chelonae]PKQ59278.1 GNAT family N-acetyltransferase [Mycobacterium sp. MHSD3]
MQALESSVVVRCASPSDYPVIIAVVDHWWGRSVASSLPRLFLDHFFATSLIAESDGALAGFVIGFHSPSVPEVAYIHFMGVAPEHRGKGLARAMYVRFFAQATAAGCSTVRAITSTSNEPSIDFHRNAGFVVSEPVADYNGPGSHRVIFERRV